MNHRICRTAVMRVGTLSLVVVTELVLWSLLLSPVCCMLAQLVVAVVHSTYDTMIVEEGGVLYHSGWVRLCLAEIMMTTDDVTLDDAALPPCLSILASTDHEYCCLLLALLTLAGAPRHPNILSTVKLAS